MTVTSNSRDKFSFTQRWFERNIPRWTEILTPLKPKPLRILEIGAFEGASTTWFLEELIQHPDAKMVVIDTFEGSEEHHDSEGMKKTLNELEQRFWANVHLTNKSNNLSVRKGCSFDELIKLNYEQPSSFDIIYIDGSHKAKDVIADAVLSWPLLANNGILIFDDYQWDNYPDDFNNPRIAIDTFCSCYQPFLTTIHHGYQVILKKINS